MIVLRSRFGDGPLKLLVVCPQIGTAVLTALKGLESKIVCLPIGANPLPTANMIPLSYSK